VHCRKERLHFCLQWPRKKWGLCPKHRSGTYRVSKINRENTLLFVFFFNPYPSAFMHKREEFNIRLLRCTTAELLNSYKIEICKRHSLDTDTRSD